MRDADSGRRYRWYYLAVAILYCVTFVVTRAWSPELRRDEVHFWPTSLLFSHGLLPSFRQLSDYGELNTPLAFLVFGWTEWLTGAGVVGARVVNCVVSIGVTFTVLGRRCQPHAGALATLGLLAFPYFLGSSVHAYTDVIATAFALGGVVAYTEGRHVRAALAFVLGISTRQYILAFPVGCLAHATVVSQPRSRTATIAYILAIASLLPWLALFGGWAPASALARQMPATASLLYLRPQNTLYFLSCIGAYYVIVERALFGPRWSKGALASIDRRGLALLLGSICIAFALFPPLGNVRYGIEEMGYLDRVARATLSTSGRITLFAGLAAAACWRFRRISLASVLVVANAGLMLKAHIAWDKYALPLLAVLWYLRAGPAVGNAEVVNQDPCGHNPLRTPP